MAGLYCFIATLLEKLHSALESSGFVKEPKNSVSLKSLISALTSIRNGTIEAEEMQVQDHSVMDWVEKLEDAVYDAEDMVDEILYEGIRTKPGAESQNLKSRARRFFPASFNRNVKRRMSIEKILKVIDAIDEEKKLFRFREVEEVEALNYELPLSKSDRLPVSNSLLDENAIYGREEDMFNVVSLLLSPGNENIEVIALVGPKGLGKTTLAQLVYNDDRVSEHFELKVWISHFSFFEVHSITRKILEATTFSSFEGYGLDELQDKLSASLTGKKFLLVFDDVRYDISEWEALKSSLESGAVGSKIIVTTSRDTVAESMGCFTRYSLLPLTIEDCWSIMVECSALAWGDKSAIEALEDIGWKIAEQCSGLPLIARVTGGLLRFKKTHQEWHHFLVCLKYPANIMIFGIPNILMLSCYHLPSQLKRCFTYCSLFPKYYEFNKEQLIYLWMAEGFLQQSTLQSMEKAGAECFNNLLKMSFFIPVDNSRFIMRDVMHDLAMSVSNGVCRISGYKEIMGPPTFKRTRHLSLLRRQCDKADDESSVDKLTDIVQTERLRTFHLINFPGDGSCQLSPEVSKVIFVRQQRLRVLSLPHFQQAELPASICKLKYLHYLDVSDSALKRLPESLCSLYFLQTLILTNCYALHVLPESIVKLVRLRKLHIKGAGLKKMPEEMGRLTSLRSLSNFIVGHGGSSIEELGALPDLHGSLCVSELQNISSAIDALAANLKAMQYLEELEFEWSFNNEVSAKHQEEVLDNLKPSVELEKLLIRFYGGRVLPNWLGDSSFLKVTSLHLADCHNCEFLPSLGQLSFLEHLSIERLSGIKCIGHEFYGDDAFGCRPFLSLKTLSFKEMTHWEEWLLLEMKYEEFPSLEELYIINCPKLIGKIPKSLPALRKLEISECEKLAASLPHTSECCVLKLHGCDKVQKETRGRILSKNDGEEPEISEYQWPAALLPSSSKHRELKLEKFNKMRMRRGDGQTVDQEQVMTLSESDGEVASQLSATISLYSQPWAWGETYENPAEERAVQDDIEPSGKLEKLSMGSYGGKEPEISECQQPAALLPSTSEHCGTVQMRSDDDQAVVPQVFPSVMHQEQDDNQEEPLSGEDGNQQLPSLSLKFSSMDIAQNQTVAPEVSPSTLHQEQHDNQDEPLGGEEGNQQFSSSSLNVSSMGTTPLKEQPADLHSLRLERFALKVLPKEILERSSLQNLYIIDCVHLETFSISPSLKTLYIHNCQSLKFPQPNKEKNQDVLLEHLCLGSSCDSLKIFPLGCFPKLRALSLWGCRNLEYLSIEKELKTELASLQSLEIKDCPNFRSFLEEECQAPNLKSLVFFNCGSLKSLQWMQSFNSLQSLYISKCPELESLPGEGLPSSLVILCISFCEKITPQRGWKLDKLHSLGHFEIEGGCLNLESFPEEGLLPTNLSSLRISWLSNVTSLNGKGLQNVTSLRKLVIHCCNKLDSLPEHMPSSLSFLSITDCSRLNPKLQSRKGKEWSSVAHIPSIHLDEVSD